MTHKTIFLSCLVALVASVSSAQTYLPLDPDSDVERLQRLYPELVAAREHLGLGTEDTFYVSFSDEDVEDISGTVTDVATIRPIGDHFLLTFYPVFFRQDPDSRASSILHELAHFVALTKHELPFPNRGTQDTSQRLCLQGLHEALAYRTEIVHRRWSTIRGARLDQARGQYMRYRRMAQRSCDYLTVPERWQSMARELPAP